MPRFEQEDEDALTRGLRALAGEDAEDDSDTEDLPEWCDIDDKDELSTLAQAVTRPSRGTRESNPNHEPAGTPKGGQFARSLKTAPGSGIISGMDQQHLRRGGAVVTPDGPGRIAGFDWKEQVRVGALVDLGRDANLRPILRHFKLDDLQPPRSIRDLKPTEPAAAPPKPRYKQYPLRKDGRPPIDAMRARGKAEKFTIDELQAASHKYGSWPTRYGWYLPIDGEKGNFYSLRRDGRIERSWLPIKRSEIVFEDGVEK